MSNPIKKVVKLISDPILGPVKEPFQAAKRMADKAGDVLKDPLQLRKK